MSTPSPSPVSSSLSHALVLGGGGSTGNAWVIGVLAGLENAGLRVTAAEMTIGTSAGATAAAQLSGASPAQLFADILAAVPPQRRPGLPGSAGGLRRAGTVVNHLERTDRIIGAANGTADMRRRMGAAAIELDAGPEHTEQWRAIAASRLHGVHWPERRLLITAVDARSGEPVVFDSRSGVDLVDAVAASTSSGPPYRIGDERYIDGGYRTNAENADLAAGYDRVLVLSPFGGRTRLPLDWRTDLATQVDTLRAHGSRVEVIVPDAESEHLFGANGMDHALRPSAAQAGYGQGSALAESLAGFWR